MFTKGDSVVAVHKKNGTRITGTDLFLRCQYGGYFVDRYGMKVVYRGE